MTEQQKGPSDDVAWQEEERKKEKRSVEEELQDGYDGRARVREHREAAGGEETNGVVCRLPNPFLLDSSHQQTFHPSFCCGDAFSK